MNLLSGSTLHQKIISVGKDPIIEESQKSFHAQNESSSSTNSIHSNLYNPYLEPDLGEETQAFTFSITERRGNSRKRLKLIDI